MPCSSRGVSGDVLKAERGAAPAGEARNLALGRPGAPPGGHYGSPARSWLITRRQCRVESAARDCKEAAGGAPRGEGPFSLGVPERLASVPGPPRHGVPGCFASTRASRRSAPPRFEGTKWKTASPAPQRIGAAEHAQKFPTLVTIVGTTLVVACGRPRGSSLPTA